MDFWQFLEPQHVNQFFALVVPGFIIISTINLFISTHKPDIYRDLIYWFICTAGYTYIKMLMNPLFILLNVLVDRYFPKPLDSFLSKDLSPILLTVVIPFIIGLIFVRLYRAKAFTKMAQSLDLGHFAFESTAWDMIFSETQCNYYVYILLKNEVEVYGIYQGGSYASSDKECRDLYLKDTYYKDEETGEWVFPEDSNIGFWVPYDEIRYIQIYH